jgi:hypothetical protein
MTMHSVQFLDCSSNVVRDMRVSAQNDRDAFRKVADNWPTEAYSVRIRPADAESRRAKGRHTGGGEGRNLA